MHGLAAVPEHSAMGSPMAKHFVPHDRRVPSHPDEAFTLPGYLPVSAAMIAVADPAGGAPNIMPLVAWAFLNRLPLYLGVSICVNDYNKDYYPRGTYDLLRRTMDFTLNLPAEDLRDAVSETGRLSRHKDPAVDKFAACGLHAGASRCISSPYIVECPISYECVVRSIIHMGSHDLFLGEVVGCHTDGEVLEVITEAGSDHITMRRDDGSLLELEWATLLRARALEPEEES